MKQPLHIDKITTLDPDSLTKPAYVSKRAKGTYISTTYRPSVLFQLSKCKQVQYPCKEDAKELNKPCNN